MEFWTNLFTKMNMLGFVIIGLIAMIFIIAIVTNLILRRTYRIIEEDIMDWQKRKSGNFSHEILNKIIDEYKNTASGNYSEVNTQAIIEKIFNSKLRRWLVGERFIKNTNSLLITLGLLGTFMGLTIAVGNIVDIFTQMNFEEILNSSEAFLSGIMSSLGGMAVAFMTSLVGVFSSILLTIILTIFNSGEARESLMVNIEEYLDNTVSLIISKDKETEYTMMNNILRETFIEFGEKIEETLSHTVNSFAQSLKSVVMDVNISSNALDNSIEKFDQSLNNFGSNMKDMNEFNTNLRNNIQRMDANFIKVTEALEETSKVVVQNYNGIEKFSDNIKHAAIEMTSYNRQVINDISALVQQLQDSSAFVKRLAEAIDSDMKQHSQEIQLYQEKFSTVMNKLNNEISTLGQHAALSFSDALSQNSTELTDKIKNDLEKTLSGLFEVMNVFKENEKLFAKTIASLPDQTLTYNEAAVSRIERKLDEVKSSK